MISVVTVGVAFGGWPDSATPRGRDPGSWWRTSCFGRLVVPKGFDLRGGAGKTARVWLQGKGGGLKPGQAFVLLPPKEGEGENAPAGYIAPLRQALIDKNTRHVNVVVCESDYRALKRGIGNLPPGVQ